MQCTVEYRRKLDAGRRVSISAALLAAVVLVVGCGPEERTLQQIELERRELLGLFITQKSRTHVNAPRHTGVHVDEATGELAYPAYACDNPDCPKREGEQPFLFIQTDPALSVGPNNELVRGPPTPSSQAVPVCPACLAIRDLENETFQEQTQYMLWAVEYLPPESAARAAELEEEYQRVYDKSQRRVGGE